MTKKTLKQGPAPYSFPIKQNLPYRFNQLSAHGDLSIKVIARQHTADIFIRFDGYGELITLARKYMVDVAPLLEFPLTAKPGRYAMERHRSGDTSFALYRVPIVHAKTIADELVPQAIALVVDLKAREAFCKALGIPLAA